MSSETVVGTQDGIFFFLPTLILITQALVFVYSRLRAGARKTLFQLGSYMRGVGRVWDLVAGTGLPWNSQTVKGMYGIYLMHKRARGRIRDLLTFVWTGNLTIHAFSYTHICRR